MYKHRYKRLRGEIYLKIKLSNDIYTSYQSILTKYLKLWSFNYFSIINYYLLDNQLLNLYVTDSK